MLCSRFRDILVVAALVLAAASPACAQNTEFAQPPEKLPKLQRGQDLDFLFGALKAAPDPEAAKAVEGRIWAVWLVSKSDTTNLLMTRVRAAVDAKNLDLAVQLLDKIVLLRPDYVEGWNRRATIRYMQKDYTRSIEDIRQVLAREPRHFGALSGLGYIMQELGDDKRALEVFRKAVDINPHLQKIQDLIKTLTEKVEGRDI
jgi:tetratricopeptide (TPR) repeat protein